MVHYAARRFFANVYAGCNIDKDYANVAFSLANDGAQPWQGSVVLTVSRFDSARALWAKEFPLAVAARDNSRFFAQSVAATLAAAGCSDARACFLWGAINHATTDANTAATNEPGQISDAYTFFARAAAIQTPLASVTLLVKSVSNPL